MSRTEVIAALEAYRSALQQIGSPIATRLRPGLTRSDIEEVGTENKMILPDEVVAIWEWHNGTEGAETDSGSAAVEFTPHGRFCSLTSSIESSRQRVALISNGNPYSDLHDRQFITLIGFQHPRIIECTPGAPPLTFLSDPASPLTDFPVLTIAERIGWWSWAIREGAWTISADGQWHVDSSRYLPGRLNVF